MKWFKPIHIGERMVSADDVLSGLTWQFWLVVAIVVTLLLAAFGWLLWSKHRQASTIKGFEGESITLDSWSAVQDKLRKAQELNRKRAQEIRELENRARDDAQAHARNVESLEHRVQKRNAALHAAAALIGVDGSEESWGGVVRHPQMRVRALATTDGVPDGLKSRLAYIIRNPGLAVSAESLALLPLLSLALVRSAIGTLHVVSVKPPTEGNDRAVVTLLQRVDCMPLGGTPFQLCEPFQQLDDFLDVFGKLIDEMVKVDSQGAANAYVIPRPHRKNYVLSLNRQGRIILRYQQSS